MSVCCRTESRSRPAGFTVLEFLIVFTVISAIAVVSFPKVRVGVQREAVRSARRETTAELARARTAAASRGCRAVLHLVAGADARLWVTTCRDGGGVDTVGSVGYLSDRFGVSLTTTQDSVMFMPTGVALSTSWTALSFSKGPYTDTLAISPLGKAIW